MKREIVRDDGIFRETQTVAETPEEMKQLLMEHRPAPAFEEVVAALEAAAVEILAGLEVELPEDPTQRAGITTVPAPSAPRHFRMGDAEPRQHDGLALLGELGHWKPEDWRAGLRIGRLCERIDTRLLAPLVKRGRQFSEAGGAARKRKQDQGHARIRAQVRQVMREQRTNITSAREHVANQEGGPSLSTVNRATRGLKSL